MAGGNSHQRAIHKAAANKHTSKQNHMPTRPEVEKRRPFLLEYTIVRLGVPLGTLGIGIALMLASIYYWGVFLLYVGLAIFLFDILYEHPIRKLSIWTRILLAAGYIFTVAYASSIFVFVPAHLELVSKAGVPEYSDGSNIDGIEWEKGKRPDLTVFAKPD